MATRFKGRWIVGEAFRKHRSELAFGGGALVVLLFALRFLLGSEVANFLVWIVLPALALAGSFTLYHFICSRRMQTVGRVLFTEETLAFRGGKQSMEFSVANLRAIGIRLHTYTTTGEGPAGQQHSYSGNNFITLLPHNGFSTEYEFTVDSLYMEAQLRKLAMAWEAAGTTTTLRAV